MTFSIVARDPATGAMGVATATAGPCVGSLVPHVQAGIGAVATQAQTNPLYGPDGLALMSQGASSRDACKHLTDADPDCDRRQLILVDSDGATAGWTGTLCSPHAGMLFGNGVAVAGNLLARIDVLDAMMEAFLQGGGAFVDRLLAAIAAGEKVGGDRRGTRSAALKILADQPYPAWDIRVDWSSDPLAAMYEVLDAMRSGDALAFSQTLPRRESVK